jgi:hypothetical protein
MTVSGINSPNRVHSPRKSRRKSSLLYFSFSDLATSSSRARMEGGLKEEDGANGYIPWYLCWQLLKSSASGNGAH